MSSGTRDSETRLTRTAESADGWPDLPAEAWADTLETLHRWTQVVGKIRMQQAPWVNHSWSVALYVTARGLGTSLVPYGQEGFEIELDLSAHRLEISTTTGARESFPLEDGLSCAAFYAKTMEGMQRVGMPVRIYPVPSEIADAIPFDEDDVHAQYDPQHAHALWRALLQAERVLTRFRAGFLGKSSPVHFFWGSFDLAVSRFSGRTAPTHPNGMPNFPDVVAQEAYSHELSSAGFWPGNRQSPTPVFYAYAYPMPDGFAEGAVVPDAASWLDGMGEFVLPYDAVRSSDEPDAELASFLESTYAASADLSGWDRSALECHDSYGPDWWRSRFQRERSSRTMQSP
jgi:hypothetical protein